MLQITPGARGSICRPRAPLCLPLGRGAGCRLRGGGCLPLGVLVVGPRVLVAGPRVLVAGPGCSLSCTNGLFRLPDATYPSSRAQKCRFCARKAGKWGFQTPKAHKNADFVLEKPENEGSEGQKRTKIPILCSKRPKTGVPKAKSAPKPRFCTRIAKAAVLSWNFINEREAGAHSQNAC